MLSRRTELRHIWSGAPGNCEGNESMDTLSRGCQSQGPDAVRPQESQVLPNLESALPMTRQVGGSSILLRLRHWTIWRKENPGTWTIKVTGLWDRLRETDLATTGNLGNFHHWTLWWPRWRNQNSPGNRHVGCRRHIQDYRHSDRRYSWPAKYRETIRRTGQRMESHRRSSHLWKRDI